MNKGKKTTKTSSIYGDSEKKYMYAFQKYKDKSVLPLLKIFMKLRITPNIVSISSIVFGILFLVSIKWNIWISLLCLILGLLSDGLDGSLARLSGKVSSKGVMIDAFSDHMLILLTTLGFYLIGIVYGWLAFTYAFAYTLFVILIYIRDKKNIPYKFVFRPRLWIYLTFLIYVVWNINIIDYSMILFSTQMLIQSIIGIIVLFRRKKIGNI